MTEPVASPVPAETVTPHAELGEFDVLDILTGYQPAAVLATAVRVGVFDAIAAGGVTAAAIASTRGLAAAPTRALLDALAGLGLVGAERFDGEDPRYRLTAQSRRLVSDGDLVDLVGKEAYLAEQWQRLHMTVESGVPVIPSWRERVADDPITARSFLRALVTLARMTGPDLTTVPELGAGARIVDVGGGLGSYAVPLARAGAAVTLVELPDVAVWAAEDTAGVAGVTVVAADALHHDSVGVDPGSADAVLLSHLLHDLDDVQARGILAGARRALRPGGCVVVVEIPGEPSGRARAAAFGPMFDLMMQIETPGRARSSAELAGLLAHAGFSRVRDAGVARPNLVLVGEAP